MSSTAVGSRSPRSVPLVVLADHRHTLRALGIPIAPMAARLFGLIREGAR